MTKLLKPLNQLEPEYSDAYNAWKAGPTPATSGALLKAVQPVLSSALNTYAVGQTSPLLRGSAKKLALGAFESYDPARAPLKAHLMSHLQRLRRESARQQQIIRVPEQVSLDRIALQGAETELEDQLGRPPSTQELADYAGLSLKRIAHVRKAVKPMAEGYFDIGADDTVYTPSVTSPKDDPTQWLEFVYDDLAERDQVIMESALGLHGKRKTPPTKIAQRLGISPSAVSQRLAKIQELIDRRGTVGLF